MNGYIPKIVYQLTLTCLSLLIFKFHMHAKIYNVNMCTGHMVSKARGLGIRA